MVSGPNISGGPNPHRTEDDPLEQHRLFRRLCRGGVDLSSSSSSSSCVVVVVCFSFLLAVFVVFFNSMYVSFVLYYCTFDIDIHRELKRA